jgi:nucleoside-diphosphate-sugar epimerase/2-polyprenyl-3-methyl-5-hydroxy-6-metoxy-1,4-benzoquinol methylase
MELNNILIIGGEGYIGSKLVDYLQERFNITILDTDNYGTYSKNVPKIIGKYQNLSLNFLSSFDIIILLAGQSSVSNSVNLTSVMDNNIVNFACLLENLTEKQKLIYISSSSVYGQTNNKDVNENESLSLPYNFYDFSKQTIDQLASLSSKHYYSLRLGTVNGFSRNLRNDVMINSMVFNAKQNGKIFVTNKDVNRAMLGINDLCRVIEVLINNTDITKKGIYNISSFNSTVDTIAQIVALKCNVPIDYVVKSNQVNFKTNTKAYDFKINSDKFKNTFNFQFNDTTETIIDTLNDNWNLIENFQNRIDDHMMDYSFITKCRVCNTDTNSLLDLQTQPLANSYHQIFEFLDKYPLHLHYCPNCFHVQLNCVVKPEKLFKKYLYVSGTSNTLKEYFYNFALNSLVTLKKNNPTSNDKKVIKILDIACNDGTQLDMYRKVISDVGGIVEIITVGVDPAQNIYDTISKHKTEHDIYCEFFSGSTMAKLLKKYSDFDIIIAQNVFAHIDYPSAFLNLCKTLMNKESLLLIQTSQKNMILNNEFDTAYHEHLSFFNTNSMNQLCSKNGVFLNNVTSVNIHGTSYLFEIGLTQNDNTNTNTISVLMDEMDQGLFEEKTYSNYALKAIRYKNNFQNKLIDYKLSQKNIIGFGCTAKVMTLLNFCQIDSTYFDYIIDENKLKQNLFTPGSNILIKEALFDNINQNTVIAILAWNFYEEIKNKIVLKLKELNITFPVTLLNIYTLEDEIIN